jgi:hypothetical protein
MLPRQLLDGLRAFTDPGFPGFYFVSDHRDPRGSSRVLCNYADGTRRKASIFELAALASGHAERPGDWDVHHVVEAQDYADIDLDGLLLTGRSSGFYRMVMPCVIIHRAEEHRLYSRLLQSRGSEKHARKGSGDLRERAVAAMARAATVQGRAELLRHAQMLIDHYGYVYEGDPVLTRIAQNLLGEACTAIRRGPLVPAAH